jgi:glycosyltransferase involved in cell wall biosynthesis
MAGLADGRDRPVPGPVSGVPDLQLVHRRDVPERPSRGVVVDGRTHAVAVSVVIPCRNEAMNLPAVLSQLPAGLTEVIIVDGRSTDNTIEVARELVPDAVIVRQTGKGKGDALRAGFEAARGEIIVMLDADGSMSPREIDSFLSELVRGADLVKGSRQLPGGGSADLTPVRAAGNWVMSTMFNRLFDASHTDLCYGYMAFWNRNLDVLMPECTGFEVETWMCVSAQRAGLRVVEVPSQEGRRIYGRSNLRTVRDGIRVLHILVGERWMALRPRRRVPARGTV